MIKVLKAIVAILDWLFMPHGYDTFGFAHAALKKSLNQKDMPANRGYILYKCKVCGKLYGASRRNKTCQNPVCFIKWRIR